MKNTSGASPIIRHIELLSFVAIFLFGMILNLQERISLEISKQSGWIQMLFDLPAENKFVGVFSGMIIFAAAVRVFILLIMQHLISKNLEIKLVVVEKASKLVLGKLLQVIISCLIVIFIFRSSTYQGSMTGTWLSVLTTALFIQIFFAALGDSIKQILFVVCNSRY